MEANIAVNNIFLPLNLHLENPYATQAEENKVPMVATTVINNEFLKNVPKLTPANPFQPFS